MIVPGAGFIAYQQIPGFCDSFGQRNWVGLNGTIWESNGFINHNNETSIESKFILKQQPRQYFDIIIDISEGTQT
jgi:hypothetical protein